MVKVSVIIPAYNAEKYIKRCVDSVLSQTFKNLECIVVNDGSKDNTLKILEEYKDERLVIIDKENSGVSATRNLAIRKAKGKYLNFIDADDWLSPDAIQLKVNAMEENHVDLVLTDFYRVVENKVSIKSDFKKEYILSRTELAEKIIDKPANLYFGVLWNKLYKKSIIKEHNIKMLEDISWSEDVIFNFEYIKHIQSAFVLKSPTYYYVKTKGSLINNRNKIIQRAIKMKTDVHSYYCDFIDETLGKEGYDLEKYAYFIEIADDALVTGISPSTKDLGKEKVFINSGIMTLKDGQSIIYQQRKLMDRLFETVAVRNNLGVNDIKIIFALKNQIKLQSIEQYADFLNIGLVELTASLTKLSIDGYITFKDELPIQIILINNDKTKELIKEINDTEKDYFSYLFSGFSDEEMAMYRRLNRKLMNNRKSLLGVN